MGLDEVVRDFRIRQLPEEVQAALADVQNTEVLHMLTSTDKRQKEAGLAQLGTVKYFREVLTSITHVDLSECEITALPEGFSKLVNLTFDSFMACIKQVQSLPESIVEHPHMRDATSLDLSKSKLVRLPESFSKLVNLTFDSFMVCIKRVQSLPESIVEHPHMRDATSLDLSYSSLVRLPESIGNCTALQTLDCWQCTSLESLPPSIGNCTALQTLNCWKCSSLQSLPPTIGELKSLEKLVLERCNELESLPEALVQQLESQGCNILR